MRMIFERSFMLLGLMMAAAFWAPSAAVAGPVLPHVEILPLFPASDAGREWKGGALLWQAQSCTECGDEDYEPGKGKSKHRYGAALSKAVTKDIVDMLKDANRTCNERIEFRYRIDCLRIYYGWAADMLPDNGDYAPIKKALRKAEKQLTAIVSKNVDRSEPVITPREGHKKAAPKMPPIRPVKKAAAKKAAAQAEAVIKETELVILRSGEDPTRRTAHFQEVAAAVDSNLVILRSA